MRNEGVGFVVLRNTDRCLVRHDNEQSARQEAERLAVHCGGEFVVMAPVAVIKPAPKVVVDELVTVNGQTESRAPF